MYNPETEMKYCRRCGASLNRQGDTHVFVCDNGHPIFCNASPATGLFIYNESGEVAFIRRAIEPSKGMLDAPGGFCDGLESLEEATYREAAEETGLSREDIGELEFILSMPNMYAYKDELLPTMDAFFRVKLRQGAEIRLNDESSEVVWLHPRDVPMDEIAFVSTRAAVEKLRTLST